MSTFIISVGDLRPVTIEMKIDSKEDLKELNYILSNAVGNNANSSHFIKTLSTELKDAVDFVT